MKLTRNLLPGCLAVLAAASFVLVADSRAERQATAEAVPSAPALVEPDPAFAAMLGNAVPLSRIAWLSRIFRAVSGGAAVPVFGVLTDAGPAGTPKYEASGLEIDVHTEYGPVRISGARLVLAPSADGRSCRFELTGSPLASTATLEASGTIEWAAGPAGGDKLDVAFRAGGVPVDALRAAFPGRFDPSFHGSLDVTGKASGVVGELTTEEAPATPLRGDVEAKLDWQILGRTAPLVIATPFSMDDRMVRLTGGTLRWQDQTLPIKGWLDPAPAGQFDFKSPFTNLDAQKIATDWNVPEAWRPAAMLSGTFTFAGKPGNGTLRYDASAPTLTVPGLEGWELRVDGPQMKGGILEINGDVAVSLRSRSLSLGGIPLGAIPVGVKWWRDKLTISSANAKLWGGDSDASASYLPAEHPKFSTSGRVRNGVAADIVAAVAPWLGLDVEGAGSLSFSIGKDQSAAALWAAHASLTSGRLGGVDLFSRTLEALAAADPVLALDDAATLVPKPRKGDGTRVDRLFFELLRSGDDFEIGGLYLKAGDFQLDADGRHSRAQGLALEGTMALPAAVADRLVAAAPWMAALRVPADSLFVPVVVRGAPSALTLELAPGYADRLAKAKRGEPVEAPGVREVRHVGPEGLAPIPGDPAAAELP